MRELERENRERVYRRIVITRQLVDDFEHRSCVAGGDEFDKATAKLFRVWSRRTHCVAR